MKITSRSKLLALVLPFSAWTALMPLRAAAEDIDIFTGSSAGTSANPNVLIVIDNTSNWSRQSQQWPGGIAQGQSEAKAIKTVLNALGTSGSNINIGLMEFVTTGNANNQGGFIRYAIRTMGSTNVANFSTKLNTIYSNIGSPDEKRSANTPYGDLMYDVYNYFAGAGVSNDGSNLTAGLNPPNYDTDAAGYATAYSRFSSPASATNSCAHNFVIFIGNPNANGPASDSTANSCALAALTGGDASCASGKFTPQLGLANFSSVGTNVYTPIGQTGHCYTSDQVNNLTTGLNAQIASCVASGAPGCYSSTVDTNYVTSTSATNSSLTGCSTYTQDCNLGSPSTSTLSMACPAGMQSYNVIQTATTTTGPTAQAAIQTSGKSTVCYPTLAAAQAGVAAGDHAGLTCPSATEVISTVGGTTTKTDTTHSCTYAADSTYQSCTSPDLVTSGDTANYYPAAPAPDASTIGSFATTPSLSCPSGYDCTYSAAKKTTATGGGTTYGANNKTGCLNFTPGSYTYNNYTNSAVTTPSSFVDNNGYTVTGLTFSCPAYNSCVISFKSGDAVSACGSGGGNKYALNQVATGMSTYTITQTARAHGPGDYYVIQTDTPTATVTTTTVTNLGQSSQCFAAAPTYTLSGSSDYNSQCTGTGVSCAYGTATSSTTNYCPWGSSQYTVQGNNLILQEAPNGTTTVDTAVYNADEWAKLLFQKGVPVAGGSNQTVSTYTIDVYNAQPNNTETGLYMSMALNGGGKYYSATNEDAIATALKKILAEIQSVNSTFASASLPVNSTNRAQNANQVFIGMFRPDPTAGPRWFGNLKQYQIGSNGVTLDLYDASSTPKPAINTQTGFLDDCAQSFWTSDSSTPYSATYPWANNVYNTDAYYWNNIIMLQTSPASKCVSLSAYSASLYSDTPDGSFVEKGGIAEVLRKGNDPAASTPTWSFNRNMYTLDSTGALVTYASSNSGLTADAFHFTQGKDVDGDCAGNPVPCGHTKFGTSSVPVTYDPNTNIMRASVHGDVVHSRPLPVNYGTTANPNAGVTAFYGANDGTFRAVIASDHSAGKELWAFTAPEFSSAQASRTPARTTDPLTRLMNNSPLVNYANVSASLVPTPLPKDYFFDGSTGIYQNIDNTRVWIYPSMRRGGRMIYSFDVTNSNPALASSQPVAFKWRAGCPDLTDDTNCTSGMTGIGQTWSTPAPVPIKGYSTTMHAVVLGGGYDPCEDADTAAPACSSGKGHVVYVLDADTGAVIRSFTTVGSVIADVSFVDVDNDGYVDYGYALDTGGNVYRINFADPANGNAPLASADWTIQRIAYTSGGGRKFQWTPGLLPSGGKVFMAFASGDRERPLISNYPYMTPVTNRLYVYVDDMVATNTNLDGATMSNFTSSTTCSTAGIGSSGNTNVGWYMDFPERGEQAVTSAVIAGGMVTVSTNRPIPPASGTCSTALGEARGYWVNLFNASGAMGVTGSCGGGRYGTFAGGGLPPSPVFGTVPINGVPTTVLIGAIQRGGGASSPIAPQKMRPTIPSTRKVHYWKNSGDN